MNIANNTDIEIGDALRLGNEGAPEVARADEGRANNPLRSVKQRMVIHGSSRLISSRPVLFSHIRLLNVGRKIVQPPARGTK